MDADFSLRSIFFDLENRITQISGVQVRRTHLYQLVAAAFGYGSWESLRWQAVLTDKVGTIPTLSPGPLVGRAIQLGYGADGQSEPVVSALVSVICAMDLRAMRLSELAELMRHHGKWPVRGCWEFKRNDPDIEEHDFGDEDEDEDNDENTDWLDSVRSSAVLRAALADRASRGHPQSHLWLAVLFRCREPQPYLHDEALRGRQLNITEEKMRVNYLRDVPKFAAYRQHLQAAAESGIALAAIECALVFGEDRWLAAADYEDNPELLLAAAGCMRDESQADNYLLRASELGSQLALEHLAALGNPAGIEHMATQGDRPSLLTMARQSLVQLNLEEAWTWQSVAGEYGLNLLDGSPQAVSSEGSHAGESYGDDVGGPLDVLEMDTIALPEISLDSRQRAKQRAIEIVEEARISNEYRKLGWPKRS